MVSPQYLDKKPELIMVRRPEGKNGLIVLRLWDANRALQGTHTTLWVGTLGDIPRPYSWLYKKRADAAPISPEYIFPIQAKMDAWQWKVIDMPLSNHRNPLLHQKILLIRENQTIHH
jgi:hypothetical protein